MQLDTTFVLYDNWSQTAVLSNGYTVQSWSGAQLLGEANCTLRDVEDLFTRLGQQFFDGVVVH